MHHLQTSALPATAVGAPYLRVTRPNRLLRDDDAARLLIRALARYGAVDRRAMTAIVDAVSHLHEVESKQPFPIRSTERVMHILVAGWGFRSHLLPDGERQITDLFAPGNFCDVIPGNEDPSTSIEACGPARVASLDTQLLPEPARLLVERGQLAQRAELIRRLRSWLVSLGRRDARGRLAYLMAETQARLAGLGLVRGSTFAWPFTQEQLADLLGLTPVHTNRVLAQLRSEGQLAIRNREVTILDLPGLHRISGFEGDSE
jgi:CRP-like cAMP-binding protein